MIQKKLEFCDGALPPGETVVVPLAIPKETPYAEIELLAFCECGGRLVRVRGKNEWHCQHLRWWRFWERDRHARLIAWVEGELPTPTP